MPNHDIDRGTAAVIALLVLVMFLSALTSWEAAQGSLAHRAAVQQVIRDDASIIADDVVRRTIYEFEEFTSRRLRRAALDHLSKHASITVADVRTPDTTDESDVDLVSRVFVLDLRTGRIDPPVPGPLGRWIATQLQATADKNPNALPTVRLQLEDGGHLIIYGSGLRQSGRLFGFEIDDVRFGRLVARALSRRPITPGLLGGGHLRNEDVLLRMLRARVEVFHSGGTFDPSYGIVRTVPSVAFGEALRGMVVQCSIAPSAVPAIVVGGVPRSRMLFLATTLLATICALGIAIFVVRRERQLAAMRSDFVSGVSHELHTPLTQIRMFAETLLLDRVRSERERRRSLEIINEEAGRLTSLVDNLLFFSRGERSTLELTFDECDIGMLIEEAVEAFEPLAARRCATIVTDVRTGLVARVDANALKQVLTNMLDNAVKYGPTGQTIRVTAAAEPDRIVMTVEDEGPGIPADDRTRIWRKFVRLDRDRGTATAGSGIGLAIVHEIVARHGGTCHVDDSPDGGARFVVSLAEGQP